MPNNSIPELLEVMKIAKRELGSMVTVIYETEVFEFHDETPTAHSNIKRHEPIGGIYKNDYGYWTTYVWEYYPGSYEYPPEWVDRDIFMKSVTWQDAIKRLRVEWESNQ